MLRPFRPFIDPVSDDVTIARRVLCGWVRERSGLFRPMDEEELRECARRRGCRYP